MVPVTESGAELRTGIVHSILSGTCGDSSMPQPSMLVIVSDTLVCLGSSSTGAPSPEIASVLGNTPQGIGLSMELISALVTRLAEKYAGVLVNHSATGGDPLEVFPSMPVTYPSPFPSGPMGCEEWAGPTDWLPSETPPALTLPLRSSSALRNWRTLCERAHYPFGIARHTDSGLPWSLTPRP